MILVKRLYSKSFWPLSPETDWRELYVTRNVFRYLTEQRHFYQNKQKVMKRICWTAILVAAITSTSCAQKIGAAKVPTAVKQAFAKAHPNVTVKWEKEDGKY